MMPIAERKTRLIFETGELIRERGRMRELIVEARPLWAVLRLKGLRNELAVSYESIYQLAAKQRADEVRRQKAKR